MYFPESFEWLILKSGVIDIKGIDDILERTEEYVESRDENGFAADAAKLFVSYAIIEARLEKL